MSGANDPYDPKQVAALSPEALDEAVAAARRAFDGAADLEALAGLVDEGVEGAIIGTALYVGNFTLTEALELTGVSSKEEHNV